MNKYQTTALFRPARRHAIVASSLLALASVFPLSAFSQTAQSVPNLPNAPTIKLIVGYAPGGPVDAAARLFAPAFARELGQPVVVENRPGAGGAMGGDSVAKAAPNGLQIFFAASPTITISPHILKSMPFDVAKDLTPVAPILSRSEERRVGKEC